MLRIPDFMRREDLLDYQIKSYNWVIDKGLQEIIEERSTVEVNVPNYELKLKKINIVPPLEFQDKRKTMLPIDYRITNLTYAAQMNLTVEETINGNTNEYTIDIGHFPIMLGSKICVLNGMTEEELIKAGEDPKDPFGYFIINGTERVLVCVEDVMPNKILVNIEESSTGKSSAVARVISIRKGFRARTTVEKASDSDIINVSFPGASKVNFAYLLKGLGLNNDEILKMFDENLQESVKKTIKEVKDISCEEAFKKLSKKIAVGHAEEYREVRTEQAIDNYLLPHIGNGPKDRKAKAQYLTIMASKILKLLNGNGSEDDKDHYKNKRIRLAGDLLQELFRVSFFMLLKDIKYQIEKQYMRKREVSVRTAIRSRTMSERIDYAMATGNWTGGRAGISQLLDRTNFISAIAHRRRVTSLLERTSPHFEARDLHPTQWGRISPNETPEGKNCGLVKNLAIGAIISEDRDVDVIKNILFQLNVK